MIIILSMFYSYLIYFFLFAGVMLSIVTHKLTIPAALLGGIVGLLVFKGGGYAGFIMLALFFILGSGATGLGTKKKQALGTADENKGRRTAKQVMANGGVAAILGAIAWCKPEIAWCKPEIANILQLMMAGSLASATADTLSSELGTLLGGRFYNIITFKKSQPGPDGVVSIEGTLIGAAGALIIAVVYSIGHGWNTKLVWIVTAGIIGNFTDSVLGATLEKKKLIGNNLVNFLNTLAGALACLLLSKI